ncbi:MAG: response regulator [Methylococcaceae bacterium]|nr:response regulator [Methylococcaceae bacterium]
MKANFYKTASCKPTLLLVDDDRLVLTTFAQGLAGAGYQVNTAESADESEKILDKGDRPDLVILDVQMPERSGLDLAERLNSSYCIPFILLTAYNDEAIVEKAAASGALGYLVKPIDVPQLIPAIEASWARAKEIQELRDTGNHLQTALAAERDVSIAVGITMVQYHVDRRNAFEMLRKSARDQRRRLSELALEVIKASETLNLANKGNK